MIEFNMLVTALAALIPLVVGAIWYNPKVFGTVWIKSTGLTEEQLKQANMAKIFILTYIVSLLVAFELNAIVIHQFGAQSMLFPDVMTEGTDAYKTGQMLMEQYGNNFRTFKHGALHGSIAGLFLALPVITIIGLFERKSAKYIFVHAGYWILCLGLMGGVICQFA